MVDAASEMTADEENRVSRILATPGLDRAAIVRLQRQTVLIAGLNGLGVASMSGLASSLFLFSLPACLGPGCLALTCCFAGYSVVNV